MGDSIISSTVGILTAVVGLAILAVVLSKKSQTASVIGSAGSLFSGVVSTAVSPVSR